MATETPKPDKPKINAPIRLVGWAGAATLALGALTLTLQSETASQRLQTAFASNPAPQAMAKADTVPAPTTTDNSGDIKRLETLVYALSADRERQAARIASLEHSLDGMTGSIKQQVADAAKAITPPPTRPVTATAVPAVTPLAMPAVSAPATAPPGWATGEAKAEASSQAAAPTPEKLAALPIQELAKEAPRKPEIGVDLGGAANLDILNARWTAVKANFGPLLSGLYPRAAKAHRAGASDYRLIAGPLPTNAAAVQLCARFVAVRVTCRAVRFDGERMVQR
jgi:hypothetical protein